MEAEKYIYSKYPKEKGYNRHFNMEQTVELLDGYAQEKDKEIKRLKQTNNPK